MTYDLGLYEDDLFDKVRRLKVPAPGGGFMPPVIGYWDRLGYTHCLSCSPETTDRDEHGYPSPIDADNSAVISDRCDSCGASILAAALARFGKPS